MLKSINALFIRTQNMEKLISFYQVLGIPLKVNNHGGGLHAEADFGDLHFAIQPTPQPFGGVIAELHDPDGNHIFLTRWQTDEEYERNFPKK